jgi:hypothetical protein
MLKASFMIFAARQTLSTILAYNLLLKKDAMMQHRPVTPLHGW